jgi:hypothetical protein
MNRLFSLTVLCILISLGTISAQSVENLDKKYGFKDFRFGQLLASDRIQFWVFLPTGKTELERYAESNTITNLKNRL